MSIISMASAMYVAPHTAIRRYWYQPSPISFTASCSSISTREASTHPNQRVLLFVCLRAVRCVRGVCVRSRARARARALFRTLSLSDQAAIAVADICYGRP